MGRAKPKPYHLIGTAEEVSQAFGVPIGRVYKSATNDKKLFGLTVRKEEMAMGYDELEMAENAVAALSEAKREWLRRKLREAGV